MVIVMFKNVKWYALITAILYIVAGVLLFVYPQMSENLICDVSGIAVIVLGLIHITSYFMMDLNESLYRNDFVEGVIIVLVGILVIYQKIVFQQLVPYVLAIVIIASGIMKLQDGIDAHRIGFPSGYIYLILASISIIFGLVVMFDLIPAGKLIYQVLGAGLAYSGITDLFSAIYLSGRIRVFREKKENPQPEAEPVLETEPEPVLIPETSGQPEPAEQPAMNFDPDTGEPLSKPEE
jgi:uncharacterized membrane protein HdeD (DUF308 family)